MRFSSSSLPFAHFPFWQTLLLLSILLMPGIGLAAQSSSEFRLSHAERAMLDANPEIKIGVMNAWPPFSYVDKSGLHSGSAADYLQAINKRLGNVLVAVPGEWNTIYNDAKSGRLDAVMDITPRPEREAYFGFTRPYMNVAHVIVASDKTDYLADEHALKGKTLALERGFVNVAFFRAEYPSVNLREYANTLAAMQAVVNGEADAYAGNRSVVLNIMRKQDFPGLKLHGLLRKSSSVLAIGVRKGWPELTALLNRVLADISAEELGRIETRWMGATPAADVGKGLVLSPEEKAWLASQSTIRVGMMDNWPPFSFVNTRGNASGISADYVAALNKRLDNKLTLVTGAWKDVYDKVASQQLDALLDVTPKPSREAHFNFTSPYLNVPHVIVAPKETPFLNNEDDLGGMTLALEKGFGNVRYFQENYPQVQIKEYRDTSHALGAVARGEADAYAGNRSVALYLIKQELMTTLKVHGRLRKSGSVLAIGSRKDWPLLASILDKALDSIEPEEIRHIQSRWIGNGKSDETILLSRQERHWLEKNPTIRIAFDGNYPPYSFLNERGEFQGIAVDFARELAGRLGLGLEIYPNGEWKQLYEAAQQREVDVIATLVKRPNREALFDFTRPYISLAQYIITRDENAESIRDKGSLSGKTLALVQGYSMSEVVQSEIEGINAYFVPNLERALEEVSIGNADATVGAIGMSNYLMTKSGLTNLSFSALYSKGQSEQRFGVRSDWPELASMLDKALNSISDQEAISLFSRWTTTKVAMVEAELESSHISLTEAERRWLEEHPRLRIGVDSQWAPVEFADNKGEYHGISMDYLKTLESILGVQVEIPRLNKWSDSVAMLKDKELDMVMSMMRTPQRAEYSLFTEPFLKMPINIFARNDRSYIGSLSNLSGQKVAVVEGYSVARWLAEEYRDIALLHAENTEEALKMVSSGQADAFVGSVVTGSYYIGKLRLTNVTVSGETPYSYMLSIGVRKDWPIMVSILQKALNSIDQSRRDHFYNRWMSIEYKHGFDYSLLWKVVAGMILIIVAVSYWNRRLAHEVAERARAEHKLEEANIKLRQLDKLKSMFVASMSHELRTPLNSIIGFTGMMLQGISGELNDEQKDNLNRVYRSGEHLLSLISDIIDISKIEAGRVDVMPHSFALKEAVDEAIELIQPIADKKQIDIQVLAASWPELHTDRKRLMQCLLNYLSNGVKYSDQGSVTVLIQEIGEDIEISVTDTGIGISEEDMPRLFEAFERLDSHLRVKAGGTGLGLYLTKKITEELLKGKVSVVSQVGQGSTFTLRIPMRIEAPAIKNQDEVITA